MSHAVLFPGQGSQSVGMGADVFAARPDLSARAGEVLGWDLAELCLSGPEEELTRTDRAQPALFTVSYALWEAFAPHAPVPAGAAGHSLGEYTALAAAEVFDFETGLALVAARGEAMARAAAGEESGMAALIGADVELAETVAGTRRRDDGRLWVANINAPGQVVVAGGAADIAWLTENGRDLGVRRVVPLKVAGAFHSPFMEPAVAEFRAALADVRFSDPRFPVWSNVSATPVSEVAVALAAQITSSVRFSESLVAMKAAGIDRFVHVGPGDVTANMAKRSLDGAETFVVSDLSSVESVARAIQ